MGSGGEGFDIGCDFGGVSLGKETCRVSVKLDRAGMSLGAADAALCGKRLTGKLVVGGKQAAPNQALLPGMEDSGHEVAGVFDVKRFGVSSKEISFGATFAMASVEPRDLAKLANSSGRLVVEQVADIPDDEADDDEADDDEGHDDHDDVGPMTKPIKFPAAPTPANKSLDELKRDAGAGHSLMELKKYGATIGIVRAVKDAAEGDTVAHLEKLMNANPEWWHRNIKGLGEQKLNILLDAHREFRKQYPQVDDEDRKDIDHAFEEGRKAFGNADELGTVPNPDYVKGSVKFRAWEMGFEHEKALFAAKVQAAKEGDAVDVADKEAAPDTLEVD